MSSILNAGWSDTFNLNEEKYSNPFITQANIDLLSNFYKLKVIKIDLICDGELDNSGFFFLKIVGQRTHIFSGGRFGFLGFSQFYSDNDLAKYLPAIDKCLEPLNLSSCCITGSYLDKNNFNEISAGWNFNKICYLVAKVSDSVDKTGLKFKKAKIRNNMNRNLKRARIHANQCRITSEEKDIKKWYRSCHLVRISELGGRIWDLELLLDLIMFGSGKLVIVEDQNGNTIGGCIFLCSGDVLELFMMSTPRPSLELGVNYILTEFLYEYAFKNNCKFINWQASNPPVGSLVDYKKSWNCLEMHFPVYSKIYDTKLDRQYFVNNFTDCYVFPFEHL
jgi:hypothetical protein